MFSLSSFEILSSSFYTLLAFLFKIPKLLFLIIDTIH